MGFVQQFLIVASIWILFVLPKKT